MSKQPARDGNQPVHVVRHRNIKASIWRNETEKGVMYKVSVVRSYRDGDEWRDTVSFGYDDLMNVAKLMYDAHSVISAFRAREANATPNRDAQAQPAAQRQRAASPTNRRKETP